MFEKEGKDPDSAQYAQNAFHWLNASGRHGAGQLCEEIMGFLKQYFDSNEEDGFFETNEMESEKVANVCNDFFGTKYNFQIHFGYEDGLRFNPAKFNLGELDPENLTPNPTQTDPEL